MLQYRYDCHLQMKFTTNFTSHEEVIDKRLKDTNVYK